MATYRIDDDKFIELADTLGPEAVGGYIYTTEGCMKGFVNCMTLGLTDRLGYELQSTVEGPTVTHNRLIVYGLALFILHYGWDLKDGDLIENLPSVTATCRIFDTTFKGKRVLRVILPDTQGHTEPDEIAFPFSLQYGGPQLYE